MADKNSAETPSPAFAASRRRRKRVLLGVAATAVVLSAFGSGASLLVKSPQQVAAEAGPPRPSLISAAVERRVLTQIVVMRGSVAPGKSINVEPGPASEGRSIVTRSIVRKGRRIKAGSPVAEVSGRPVIALRGAIPAYRDIRPGAKGPDVAQLQTALRDLGYAIGDESGRYGASTQEAVRRMYDDRGYEPPTAETAPAPAPSPSPRTPRPSPAKSAAKSQVYVRMGELVFVPAFPARITEVNAGLGDEVKGTMLKLAAGDLVVRGRLAAADRKLVEPGQHVKILAEAAGIEATGKVSSIGPFDTGGGNPGDRRSGAGDDQAVEPGHPIMIEGSRPLPDGFAAQDVRLTIEAARTAAPVLAVPSAAIYASADGSTQVLKLDAGGRRLRVTVRVGTSAAGFVEVGSAQLAEGDRVVVSR